MFLIGNGRLLTRCPEMSFIENGAVLVEGELIKKIGPFSELNAAYPNAELIDAKGGLIMPGFINAHTHFYTSLLRGYNMPGFKSGSLFETLSQRSWKLDMELDFDDVIASAYAGAIECIKNGVTTVFDHHSSYRYPSGTLMAISGVIDELGIRAALCYETSNRAGINLCIKAVEENESFIDFCQTYRHKRIRALFGLHAPFTLADMNIEECVRRNMNRTGFHVHVSEGLDDKYVCMHNYGVRPVERLKRLGVLSNGSLLIHCVHTDPEEWDVMAASDCYAVNAPQSNMSNAVGTANVAEMLSRGVKVGLGTDSFTYDMPESARAFVIAQRSLSGKPYIGLSEASKLLFGTNAEIASRYFGEGIGLLREGAPADIIILDSKPFTKLDASNADQHIIMGMSGRDCSMTMVNGKVLMRDRKLMGIDEEKIRAFILNASDSLWKRLDEGKQINWARTFFIPEKGY